MYGLSRLYCWFWFNLILMEMMLQYFLKIQKCWKFNLGIFNYSYLCRNFGFWAWRRWKSLAVCTALIFWAVCLLGNCVSPVCSRHALNISLANKVSFQTLLCPAGDDATIIIRMPTATRIRSKWIAKRCEKDEACTSLYCFWEYSRAAGGFIFASGLDEDAHDCLP